MLSATRVPRSTSWSESCRGPQVGRTGPRPGSGARRSHPAAPVSRRDRGGASGASLDGHGGPSAEMGRDQDGLQPEEASSSSHLPAWIEIVQALGDSRALRGILGRLRPLGAASRSANSSSTTSNPLRERKGHQTAPDIYLFFFSFFFFRFSFGGSWAFFCCSFLPLSLFPLSPISVSPCLNLSAQQRHRAASSLSYPFPTAACQIDSIRVLGPNNARRSRVFSQLRAVVSYAAQTVTVVPQRLSRSFWRSTSIPSLTPLACRPGLR